MHPSFDRLPDAAAADEEAADATEQVLLTGLADLGALDAGHGTLLSGPVPDVVITWSRWDRQGRVGSFAPKHSDHALAIGVVDIPDLPQLALGVRRLLEQAVTQVGVLELDLRSTFRGLEPLRGAPMGLHLRHLKLRGGGAARRD